MDHRLIALRLHLSSQAEITYNNQSDYSKMCIPSDIILEANPDVSLNIAHDNSGVLFDPNTGDGFGLNEVGTHIWNNLNGHRSYKILLETIHATFDHVPEESDQHVTALLIKLLSHGLIGCVIRDKYSLEQFKEVQKCLKTTTESYPFEPIQETMNRDIYSDKNSQLEFYYRKRSMVPTFRPGDRLLVQHAEENGLRRGDVIVFHSPTDGARVTHRIIATSSQGFLTRGDNPLNDTDPWILREDDIIGIVLYVDHDGRRKPVRNGTYGLITHYAQRLMTSSKSTIRNILFPRYLRLGLGGILERISLSWILPIRKKPAIVVIRKPEGYESILMLGTKVIGRRPPGGHYWSIRFTYLPFIDSAFLRSTKSLVDGVDA